MVEAYNTAVISSPTTPTQKQRKQKQIAHGELGRLENAEAGGDAAGGQLVGVDEADGEKIRRCIPDLQPIDTTGLAGLDCCHGA